MDLENCYRFTVCKKKNDKRKDVSRKLKRRINAVLFTRAIEDIFKKDEKDD